MHTSEYAETKAERRGAKKVTRHPLYQKLRERALAAEAQNENLHGQMKKIQKSKSKHEAKEAELVITVQSLQDEIVSLKAKVVAAEAVANA